MDACFVPAVGGVYEESDVPEDLLRVVCPAFAVVALGVWVGWAAAPNFGG